MKQKENPKPNFTEIGKYINELVVNKNYFENNFSFFSKSKEYDSFRMFLKDEKLATDSNLYFFGVYYYDALNTSKWATEVGLHKVFKNYNKDLKELKSFFSELKYDYYNPEHKNDDRDYLLSFTFRSKKKDVIVKTHPLLFDMFFHISDWVESQKERTKPKENSIATYHRSFIKSTQPLFNYLHHTHFNFATDETIHTFIANFVDTLGYDWEGKDEIVKSEYIRKAYK